jgi:transposase
MLSWLTRPRVWRARPVRDDEGRQSRKHHTHKLIDIANVFAKKSSDLLDRWITQTKTDGIAQLTRYAAGLLDDLDAVRAGVALPHSSGVAEGRVTDLKLVKRQMAGRAGIRLLRKRVIPVAHSRRSLQRPANDSRRTPR